MSSECTSSSSPPPFVDILDRFCVWRGADVLELNDFCRYQDVPESWKPMSRPRLVIFISHRWESQRHPDPNNQQQLQSVRAVLSNMKRVMEVVESGRRGGLPSLRRHGVLQAAELVYRLVESPLMDDDGIEDLSSSNILEQYVGVWYDFISMPQRPRTAAEQDQFNTCLKCLSHFVALPVVHTLSLRCDRDDYDSRAWCVAEICAAWGLYRDAGSDSEYGETSSAEVSQLSFAQRYPISLRMDLLNRPLPVPDALNEVDTLAMQWESEHSEKSPVNVLTEVAQALQRHSKAWHSLDRGHNMYHCPTGADLSCRWSVLVANGIYCSAEHAAADEDGRWVDLEAIIRSCGQELHMACTNQKDVVLAGLITCHALHWPEAALHGQKAWRESLTDTDETNIQPSFCRRDLFSDAIERWMDGKSLRFWMRSDLINAIFVERNDSCYLDRSVFLYNSKGDDIAFAFEET